MSSVQGGSELLLWAVDPFAENVETQIETARAAQALAESRVYQVQPVYAVIDPLPNLDVGFKDELYRELRRKAQVQLNRMLRDVPFRDLLPLAVLESPDRSVGVQVETVLTYANEMKARLIVSSTNARKGPVRWLVGSFAETLSLKSRVPIFLVNPHSKQEVRFKVILFPTDFSDQSHRAFTDVVLFAKSMGSQIRLFHKFGFEFVPGWDLGMTEAALFSYSGKDELREFHLKAMIWEKEAAQRGVQVTLEIDEKSKDSVVDAILFRAAQGADLIAMAGESTSFEAGLLGSIARRVIREALTPIWILHPGRDAGSDSMEVRSAS